MQRISKFVNSKGTATLIKLKNLLTNMHTPSPLTLLPHNNELYCN